MDYSYELNQFSSFCAKIHPQCQWIIFNLICTLIDYTLFDHSLKLGSHNTITPVPDIVPQKISAHLYLILSTNFVQRVEKIK